MERTEGIKFNDDGHFTLTSTEQKRVEDIIGEYYRAFKKRQAVNPSLTPKLLREEHTEFLRKGLISLTRSYEALDASRPWLTFWILHSLELLKEPLPAEVGKNVVRFLSACQAKTGGFGGGPGQNAHLATTYAAVMSLCIIGTEAAYKSIDRNTLKSFLERVKQPDGGFHMHEGGELDIRGAYCAAVVAQILDLPMEPLFDKTPQWIVSCQTYEGGFAAYPGCEAHGGYTFCGLATLILLGHESLCDTRSLLRWLSFKQMRFEGGFQGRTNKLVDGCYSYWQAAAFPLIQQILKKHKEPGLHSDKWMFDVEALQEYILICCQSPLGGLWDKPEKARDFYHTCYTLSGLSISQYLPNHDGTHAIGPKENVLVRTHPLYNVTMENAEKAANFFKSHQ